MKLSHVITGAAIFGLGSCYGKPVYTAIRNWYNEKPAQTDSVLIANTLQTIRQHPVVVDSYIRALSPTERQALIARSVQVQSEYFLQAEKKR